MVGSHAGLGKRYSSPQGEGTTVSTPIVALLTTPRTVPSTSKAGLQPEGEAAPNTLTSTESGVVRDSTGSKNRTARTPGGGEFDV